MDEELLRHYYGNLDITAYPTSNSIDEGKINLEENMSAIVTRITNRNYALTTGSFNLTLDPDDTYGQVISVAPGEANIQGYHIITKATLRVPPPTKIASGNHIVLGMKLTRDGSEHLRGDVTYAGVTHYEGVIVDYYLYEDPMDPDIFILGYLDWNGTAISNVVDNPEKYGRLDAKDIICYLSDPKHPEYEFLTLQQLTDNLKDWYVSKIGDDEYGEILWRTSDKPTDPDNWGVSVVANSSSKSTITVKPSLVTDTAHTIVISSDYTMPYINIADTEMSVRNSDLTIKTVRDLILNAGRDIIGIAKENITNKIDGTNSLVTNLTKNNYTLSNTINPDGDIDFTITGTNSKMKLSDALFDYSTITKYLTISGLQRLMIANPTEFQSDSRMDQKLYFGNTPFTGSWIDKDNLRLTTTKNYTINLGDSGNGLNVKSNTSGTEPVVRVENAENAYAELRTNGNNAYMNLQATGNGTTYINFKGGDSRYDNYFYKLPDDAAIHVKKDFAVDGEIKADKVWRAVYN